MKLTSFEALAAALEAAGVRYLVRGIPSHRSDHDEAILEQRVTRKLGSRKGNASFAVLE